MTTMAFYKCSSVHGVAAELAHRFNQGNGGRKEGREKAEGRRGCEKGIWKSTWGGGRKHSEDGGREGERKAN